MRKTLTFMCVLAVVAIASPTWATNTTWDNMGGTGDGLWTTTANWTNGIPNYDYIMPEDPIVPDNDAFIGNAGNGDCTLNGFGEAYRTRVGIASGVGRLRITTGATLETRYWNVGHDTNPGTVYQSGGLAECSIQSYDFVTIGASAPGYYYMSGGTLNMGVIWMASYAGSSGYMLQTGGLVSPHGGTSIECGWNHSTTCEYEIQGGTLAAGGEVTIGSTPADAGTGTFHVVGSASVITIGGDYIHMAKGTDGLGGGTLECGIDSGGITTIQVAGNATFNEGSTLDMYLIGVTPNLNDTFDLLTAQGTIDTTGLSLSTEDVGTWTFAVVSGSSETLQATYVPEPATLALLGVGLLGVVIRRKRR